MTAQASLSGVHHIALNVRDLEASVRWYGEVLGFTPLLPWDTDRFERRLLGHASGLFLALTRHRHPLARTAFDERRTGLDHVAFGVQTLEELEAWSARLTAAGIDHKGIQVTPSTGFTLLAFRDPDGIQLELYLADH